MDGQQTHEKILNITHHQGNVNQNYNDISPISLSDWLESKRQEITGVGEGVNKKEPHALLVVMQTGAATVENSMKFPQKIKIEIPYDLVILLLGIYTKKMKTIPKDTCSPIVIAALFTIAKMWKLPKCPLIDEWRRCVIYVQWHIM